LNHVVTLNFDETVCLPEKGIFFMNFVPLVVKYFVTVHGFCFSPRRTRGHKDFTKENAGALTFGSIAANAILRVSL